jgi:hypothetical protein
VADCSGPCRACNVAGAAGACRNIPANGDARPGACPAEAQTSCGRTGKCDGAGGCQVFATGSPCGLRSCSGSTAIPAATCNGTGACIPGSAQSCGNYACLGDVCGTTCSTDSQCVNGTYCGGGVCRVPVPAGGACSQGLECTTKFCVDGRCCQTMSCTAPQRCVGAGGTCTDKLSLGAACQSADQCGSGFCADNHCCDTACTETCRRCEPSGVCTVITNGRDTNGVPPCAAPSRCTMAGVCQ